MTKATNKIKNSSLNPPTPQDRNNASHQQNPIIAVQGLSKDYGKERVVSNVSLELAAGETLGLVGESGSGKSTIGRCILGITQADEGRILYQGNDLTGFSLPEKTTYRRKVQMIFQDPYSAFDPKRDFGFSLKEPLLRNQLADKSSADGKIDEILRKVGLDPALKHRYPRSLSGGQCQRMNIARVLLLMPEVIICDEPVSSLDMSIQAQILNLLKELQQEFNLTYLLISHDLSVIKYMSDTIAVIHKGRIVESGDSTEVLKSPQHEYTRHLIKNLKPSSPYVTNQTASL